MHSAVGLTRRLRDLSLPLFSAHTPKASRYRPFLSPFLSPHRLCPFVLRLSIDGQGKLCSWALALFRRSLFDPICLLTRYTFAFTFASAYSSFLTSTYPTHAQAFGLNGAPKATFVYVAIARDDLPPAKAEAFAKEALALHEGSHPHLLKMLGVCFLRLVTAVWLI